MRTLLPATLLALSLVSCHIAPPPEQPAYGGGTAQLFEDMGVFTRKVTTESEAAQTYFTQGINWLYAFNHDEAVRSFTRAAELDPMCARAWWGISYAQGPNYNDWMMVKSRYEAASSALEQAEAQLDDETDAERALIVALKSRYSNPPPDDQRVLNRAFSAAMAEVWKKFPKDADVGSIYAESMMVQHPWALYSSDGEPAREQTLTIISTLEEVLERNPNHPGANHLYIHAIEPSNDKMRAVPAADRLSTMVPVSGHLVHMPSHIYVQVGMWERSIEQNTLSMKRDDEYRKLAPYPGIQEMYMTHNSHMLAFSAMMIGREAEATHAAQQMWDDLSPELMAAFAPFFDVFMCSIYDVQKRFGRWDDLIAAPAPPKFFPVTTAVWRAHRAVAYAAKKDFENAVKEQQAFRAALKAVPPPPVPGGYGTALKFLLVSELFIDGEIALQKGDWEQAVGYLEQAVAIEDTIGYGEPPMWLQPVRHTLAAVYLKAGEFAAAERTYREDLKKWKDNGWSLYGLSRALEEQGKADEAKQVKAAYERVWKGAEQETTTSCKCIPKT
ncbi:MAG: tetratricopeptide repeat protein [Planctomycetota bacterium]